MAVDSYGTSFNSSHSRRIILFEDLKQFWQSGLASGILFFYSLGLGIISYLFATNIEFSITPPEKMVFQVVQVMISFGTFLAVLLAADAISGERERDSLEALLLTPTKKSDLVMARYLGSLAIWPVVFLVTLPFIGVLAPTRDVFLKASVWGAIVGTLIVMSFSGIAMIISITMQSNKISMLASLLVLIGFIMPSQLPLSTNTQFGKYFGMIHPIISPNQFLSDLISKNIPVQPELKYLLSPFILVILVGVSLFVYFTPRLQLNGGLSN